MVTDNTKQNPLRQQEYGICVECGEPCGVNVQSLCIQCSGLADIQGWPVADFGNPLEEQAKELAMADPVQRYLAFMKWLSSAETAALAALKAANEGDPVAEAGYWREAFWPTEAAHAVAQDAAKAAERGATDPITLQM